MKKLIENFPQQLYEAIQIAKANVISFASYEFSQVFVSGLGGSGIGASIVQEYVFDKLSIPFVVNKNYFIPKSVNANTLFIACSYSGNTEETISALLAAKKQKCSIVCITSGGEMSKIAKKNGFALIEIPAGMPPRACLGYSLVQLLFVLKYAKLLNTGFEKEIVNSVQRIIAEGNSIQKKAKSIAKKLVHKEVAIYSVVGSEGLAVRFRQQLNENSKVLAWHNIIPEMTHNEIVGWKTKHNNLAVVFCYQEDDYIKNVKRLNILHDVVKKYTSNISTILINGKNYWDKAFYFIHLTDWISFYLSEMNQNDAVEVKVIDQLKAAMSKK